MTLTSRERATTRLEQDGRVLAALMGENLTCTAMSERVVKLRALRAHVTVAQRPTVRTRLGETA